MASLFDDPLNDVRAVTAVTLFASGAPLGALLGGLLGMQLDRDYSVAGFLAGMLVALPVLLAWFVIGTNGGATRLLERGRVGAGELAQGAVAGPSVPARVAQRGPWSSRGPASVVGGPSGADARWMVLVSLGERGLRRVVVPMPVHLPAGRGTPYAVALHPVLDDVAALDLRVPADVVRRGDANPRWPSRMPGMWWSGPTMVMTPLSVIGSVLVLGAVSLLLTTVLPG